MNQSMTIAVDLATTVFEIAIADERGRIQQRKRLSRSQFLRFLATHPVANLVMEACGTAHYWGREAVKHGHQVRLLPAQYVARYRLRNKTDRADCDALLEASRRADILPVPIKTEHQQAIQALHRMRSQWMSCRTARINALRGLLREHGIMLPPGAKAAIKAAPTAVDDERLPLPLRHGLLMLIGEILSLEERVAFAERELKNAASADEAAAQLMQIPGIGLLIATALIASAGSPSNFKSGRHLAAWLGLTPREHSSGERRHLGGISKRGDVYVRTLLVHGARSVLNQAKRNAAAGKPLSRLQRWGLELQARVGHNKAACGVANKIARISWAVWQHGRSFDPNHGGELAMAA